MAVLINTPNPSNPNVAPPVKLAIGQVNAVPPKGSFWGGVTETVSSLASVVTTGAQAYANVQSALNPPKSSVTPTVYQIGAQQQPSTLGGLSTPVLPNTYVTVNPDGSKRLIDEAGETLTVAQKSGGISGQNIAIIAGVIGLATFLLTKGGK
jgi:ABC-type sulfate transport system substrate-binding protein